MPANLTARVHPNLTSALAGPKAAASRRLEDRADMPTTSAEHIRQCRKRISALFGVTQHMSHNLNTSPLLVPLSSVLNVH